MLQPDERVSVLGRRMSKRELLMEALRLEKQDPAVYVYIALTMEIGESRITLPDKRSVTIRDLYREAIHLDTRYGVAYRNLGRHMRHGESIKLLDGRTMTTDQLLAMK